MTDQERREELRNAPGAPENLERLDEDLNIMERHAESLARSEEEIKEAMRRRDREYKNDRFHSVPKPRKHIR